MRCADDSSAAMCSSASCDLAVSTRSNPLAARSRAISSPMPPDAPVTRARWRFTRSPCEVGICAQLVGTHPREVAAVEGSACDHRGVIRAVGERRYEDTKPFGLAELSQLRAEQRVCGYAAGQCDCLYSQRACGAQRLRAQHVHDRGLKTGGDVGSTGLRVLRMRVEMITDGRLES